MKTKKLLDKNGNPIQIEQGQVRGLKEALANVGGGGGSVGLWEHNIYIEMANEDGEVYVNVQKILNTPTLIDRDTIKPLIQEPQVCVINDAGDTSYVFAGVIYADLNNIYIRGIDGENPFIEYTFRYEDILDIVDTVTEIASGSSGGTGSGASGKEIITADSDFYNSLLGQQGEQNEFFINFSNVDLNDKYVYLDLAKYYQSWESAEFVVCEFMHSTIKNATITMYYPPIDVSKIIYFNFKDGGTFILDEATRQLLGNTLDIDGYTNDGSGTNFNFSLSSEIGDFRVKIDFDECGFATCIVTLMTEL